MAAPREADENQSHRPDPSEILKADSLAPRPTHAIDSWREPR